MSLPIKVSARREILRGNLPPVVFRAVCLTRAIPPPGSCEDAHTPVAGPSHVDPGLCQFGIYSSRVRDFSFGTEYQPCCSLSTKVSVLSPITVKELVYSTFTHF
eukprot:1005991-Pyramimonas_sp.AAC.1